MMLSAVFRSVPIAFCVVLLCHADGESSGPPPEWIRVLGAEGFSARSAARQKFAERLQEIEQQGDHEVLRVWLDTLRRAGKAEKDPEVQAAVGQLLAPYLAGARRWLQERWLQEKEGDCVRQILLSGGSVFVCGSAGGWAYDLADGHVRWNMGFPGYPYVIKKADGTLLLAGTTCTWPEDGWIRRLEEGGGEKGPKTVWERAKGFPGPINFCEVSGDKAVVGGFDGAKKSWLGLLRWKDGTTIWARELANAQESPLGWVSIEGERVLAFSSSFGRQEKGAATVCSYSAADGKEAGDEPFDLGDLSLPQGSPYSPVRLGEGICLANNGEERTRLFRLDPVGKRIVWDCVLPGQINFLRATANGILAGGSSGLSDCWVGLFKEADGKPLWAKGKEELGHAGTLAASLPEGIFVYGWDKDQGLLQVRLLDPGTGKVLSSKDISLDSPPTDVVPAGEGICAAGNYVGQMRPMGPKMLMGHIVGNWVGSYRLHDADESSWLRVGE